MIDQALLQGLSQALLHGHIHVLLQGLVQALLLGLVKALPHRVVGHFSRVWVQVLLRYLLWYSGTFS